MIKLILAIIAIAIGALVASTIVGASSWKRATRAEIDRLASPQAALGAFNAALVENAPPPVARYLRMAITDGHPLVHGAIATQEAEFFINGGWKPLKATQHFSTTPPGFVWDARIAMAPMMPAFVRDAYGNQRAKMQASMYGVYTIVNQVDNPQLNAGALQRYLGESVWFPTALVPSDRVTWTAKDERSATVTLVDGPNRVSLLFEFGDDGMPRTISGDRHKEDNGSYSLQTWQIICDDKALRDGLAIPLHCEVAWIVNGERQPYWRGRIASIEYHYEPTE